MSLRLSFLPLPAGIFALGGGVFLLVRGLGNRNPYELVLGGVILCITVPLFLAGFLAARRLRDTNPGWTPPSPLSAGNGAEPHIVTGPDGGTPWFFRIHFAVRGLLELGCGRRLLVSAETTPGNGYPGEMLIRFPLSGVFHGRGRCVLRDVFGLFAFPCGPQLHRSLPVLPHPHNRRPRLRIDPFSGSEDKQNRRNADEERYHMREYTPGDRYRDINWKVSSRLAQLVTRISPFTQEKTRTVHLEFRSQGPVDRPSLGALWILDRVKARLLMFLRALREEHPEYIFRIRTAVGDRDVGTEDELAGFAADLAGMSYTGRIETGLSGGELYIFSTCYDLGLPGLLSTRTDGLSHLYITFPAGRSSPNPPSRLEVRTLFTGESMPGSNFLSVGRHPELPSVPVPPRGTVEVDYAEVRP